MRRLVRLGWLLLAIGPAVGWIMVSRARPSEVALQEPKKAEIARAPGKTPFDSLTPMILAKAPFQLSRQPPSPGAGGPSVQASAPVNSTEPAMPAFVLAGIAWSRRPLAVIEGIPGASEPRVVTEGDSMGGFRVKRIRRTEVVVTGRDTTLTLRTKDKWP